MVTIMKVNGETINVMAKVFILTSIVLDMMEIGKTTSNQDEEWKHGLTARPTKANIKMERKTDTVNSNGQIVVIL